MTTRSDILDTAKSHVTKDRAKDHGPAEDSFGLIARYWGVYLGRELSPHDVGLMMVLFKAARAQMNSAHLDSFVDHCGYGACAGELASKNSAKPAETSLGELKSNPDFRDIAKDASSEELRNSLESAMRHARAKASTYNTIYDPSGSSDASQG